MPLLGAIAGCHCEKAIAGCHCEKKLARVIHHSPLHLSLHCDNTNWLVLCGVYAGIILWTSAAIIYGQCSPPDPNHPRVPRASVETDTKKNPASRHRRKKKTWKLKGCLLSLPHCFQEHHEEKTQEEDKN